MVMRKATTAEYQQGCSALSALTPAVALRASGMTVLVSQTFSGKCKSRDLDHNPSGAPQAKVKVRLAFHATGCKFKGPN